jgi:hypothetical protein
MFWELFILKDIRPLTSLGRLAVFERKVVRRTCDPVQDNGTWRRRYNNELYLI